MNGNFPDVIDAFRGIRAAVIGDVMLDRYIEGTTGRLCREAPVPIVNVAAQVDAPGGAANAAANLHSLGAEVRLISAAGIDFEGDCLGACLASRRLPADGIVRAPERRTLAKNRVVAGSQMLVRFDAGSTEPVAGETEASLLARLEEALAWADVVLVSDYGYGVLTPAVLELLRSRSEERGVPVVVDAKDLPRYSRVRPLAVKPNFDELSGLLGLAGATGRRVEAVADCGERLHELTGARIVAVTLDTEGALVFEQGQAPYRTYAHPVSDSRAAGAGDTFIATLALALSAGAGTAVAAELASAAANVVVTKEGTASCSASELARCFTGEEKWATDLHTLRSRVQTYREQGRRIVFTNGCFDIIHSGHVAYLNRAKSLGDVLIVGVNSDDSVRRLKGPERPINGLDDRLQILAALSCVDYLVPFDEDTPAGIIHAVRPDVFVKGGDYSLDTLPEAELVQRLGGVVEILPYLEERSTTGIINRIRAVTF